jgi:hypothetical protein
VISSFALLLVLIVLLKSLQDCRKQTHLSMVMNFPLIGEEDT